MSYSKIFFIYFIKLKKLNILFLYLFQLKESNKKLKIIKNCDK